MPDLIHKHEREALAARIKADINEYCRVTYDDGFRNHLGASLIGRPCERELWYTFRWVQGSQFDGRMQRLFNRGHKEEDRWLEWLRGIGAEVWAHDPNTGKQFRVTEVGGHFGGSLDAIIKLPPRYQITFMLLGEFKTYSAKTFAKLLKEGLRSAKPEHFAQMSKYGAFYGFKYALYCPINKDTDDIEPMVIELDWSLADDLRKKAEAVITSPYPPPRINESPAFHVCKYCDYANICHGSKPYEKNCRSCINAVPVEGGQWQCGRVNQIIPEDFLKVGCSVWQPAIRP